jgi:hypothetical protein
MALLSLPSFKQRIPVKLGHEEAVETMWPFTRNAVVPGYKSLWEMKRGLRS